MTSNAPSGRSRLKIPAKTWDPFYLGFADWRGPGGDGKLYLGPKVSESEINAILASLQAKGQLTTGFTKAQVEQAEQDIIGKYFNLKEIPTLKFLQLLA